jgi:tRNA A37 methylthiotransferase MiaB
MADLVDALVSERAEQRVGETVQVLIEEIDDVVVGRAAHQGPEVDGSVQVDTVGVEVRVGELVSAVVTGSEGADLVAELRSVAASPNAMARERVRG